MRSPSTAKSDRFGIRSGEDGTGEVLAELGHLDLDPFAGTNERDEHHEVIDPTDALSTEGEVGDGEGDAVADLEGRGRAGSRGRGRRG